MVNVSEHHIAELVEAAALQTEIAHLRLALESGHMMLTRMVQLWDQLEILEAVAYEDKVAAQVDILDETVGSLWRLHKVLAHTRRMLQHHQRGLRRQGTSLDPTSTPASRLSKAGAKTGSPGHGCGAPPPRGLEADDPSHRRCV
ncbi:MAG TPA: hypothetical protein VNP04_30545 [Alphaproteobacteria bacterium]|nr:hypothetical protein [Alphaproteobacteria bacterium]